MVGKLFSTKTVADPLSWQFVTLQRSKGLKVRA